MAILEFKLGGLGSMMVSKLGLQTITSEFESHCVTHLHGFVPHSSKKLRELLLEFKLAAIIINYWCSQTYCYSKNLSAFVH